MPNDPRPLCRWLAPLLVAFAAGPTFARAIDCALASKSTLDAADSTALRKFVSEQMAAVKSAEPATSEQARNELIAPLHCAQVSPGFRLEMSRAANADLVRLVVDPQDHVALNALRLCGEIGTQQATDAIRAGLTDKRPAVRCMAAMAMRDVLRSASGASAGAIRRESLEGIVDGVATRLSAETDVNVVENLVIALDATSADPVLHTAAMRKLAVAMLTQTKALRAAPPGPNQGRWARVLIRAIEGVNRPMTAANAAALDAEFYKSAALFAGQALAFARDSVSSDVPQPDSPEARLLNTLVNVSERVLIFADSAIRQSTSIPKQTLRDKFDQAVKSSEPGIFSAEAAKWIGDSGVLTKPPYSAKASDFAAPSR